MIEEEPQGHVLRVLLGLICVIVVACWRDLDTTAAGLLQKKLKSIGICELGNPVEISDQPLGIV
ncbi:MAG: hypothetical protein WB822_13475, partial [Rhodoplanes sp.]